MLKHCQNCKGEFEITQDDEAFYRKMDVPAPTWCPECDLRRRLSFRNERTLYKRKCNAPGHTEDIISVFHKDSPLTVFDQKYWWSDNLDTIEYGLAYDFSKPFFTQFHELMLCVPVSSLFVRSSVNCDYCNVTLECKNCYFYFGSGKNEDCMYSSILNSCRDCVDCSSDMKSESCYETIDSTNSSRVFFSSYAVDCADSAFLFNCRNCMHCFGCINLRSKSYCVFNKQYSKEQYFEELKKYNFGNFSALEEIKGKVKKFFLENIFSSREVVRSSNVSGNNIFDSKNCNHCFDIYSGVEDSKNIFMARNNSRDLYNSNSVGWNSELIYEGVSIVRAHNVKFSLFCWDGKDISYSDSCHNCSDCFGCIGLRNKQYCVFNRQYTKEEYEALIPKIIVHMNEMPYIDQKGRSYAYGEFFPSELSPFGYNEAVVQEYFPLTKEEAIRQGFAWRDQDSKDHKPTIAGRDMPEDIKEVDDSITKEIIQCEHDGNCAHQCSTAFRIVPEELQFYRRMNIALPRLCPNCRHYERLSKRSPIKLWHRTCACGGRKSQSSNDKSQYENTTTHEHGDEPCQNEFETSYSPERPEIVYCESCHQAEVV